MTEKNSGLVRTASKAYGYNYTSLADIAAAGYRIPDMEIRVDDQGEEVIFWKDEKTNEWRRGARIIVPEMRGMNKAQQYACGITYARRVTCYLALNLAPADDSYFEAQDPAKEENAAQTAEKAPQIAKREVSDGEVEELRNQMFVKPSTAEQREYILQLYSQKEILKMMSRMKKKFEEITFEEAEKMIQAREARNDTEGKNS